MLALLVLATVSAANAAEQSSHHRAVAIDPEAVSSRSSDHSNHAVLLAQMAAAEEQHHRAKENDNQPLMPVGPIPADVPRIPDVAVDGSTVNGALGSRRSPGHRGNSPVRLSVFHDLFHAGVLRRIESAMRNAPASEYVHERADICHRRYRIPLEKLGAGVAVTSLRAGLLSPAFLTFLEALTGHKNLMSPLDAKVIGGASWGLSGSATLEEGMLVPHTDMNYYYAHEGTQLLHLDHRRGTEETMLPTTVTAVRKGEERILRPSVVVLLFLNEGWEDAWGGHLSFYHQKQQQQHNIDYVARSCPPSPLSRNASSEEDPLLKCVVRAGVDIVPALGTVAIFENTERSYHGIRPVRAPGGRARLAIQALFYSPWPTARAPPIILHSAVFQQYCPRHKNQRQRSPCEKRGARVPNKDVVEWTGEIIPAYCECTLAGPAWDEEEARLARLAPRLGMTWPPADE